MRIADSAVKGCYELLPERIKDERGLFVKTFRDDLFAYHRLETRFTEQYYSVSQRHVVRGLHFQIPPHEHNKLVYCISGRVIDAVVDLRIGSPTYRRIAMFELTADRANMIYIPSGLAHGFCVLSETATLIYNVSSRYSPEHDKGIRWDSAGIPWTVSNPILSERDRSFPGLDEYNSPFTYHADVSHQHGDE